MDTIIKTKTYYLFSNPSFISGIARILDFGSTFDEYNTSESSKMADYVALRNDWEMVGADLESSFKIIGKQIDEESK